MSHDNEVAAPTETWLVRTTDPGLDACRDAGLVAVNFWVRVDPTYMTAGDLKGFTGVNRAHQLYNFVNEIQVGSRVVTKCGRDWFEGVVVRDFEYQEPPAIPDHPHVRAVHWADGPLDMARSAEVERAARKGNVLVTVKRLELAEASSSHEIRVATDLAPTVPAVPKPPAEHQRIEGRELPVIAVRTEGIPVWPDVDDGPLDRCRRPRSCRPPLHTRYRHTMTLFEEPTRNGPAILYVGLNPTCPDDVTQPTFAPSIEVARMFGPRWVGMTNLLAFRTRHLDTQPEGAHDLRGGSREVLEAMIPQVDVVIAAWSLSPRSDVETEAAWTVDALQQAGIPIIGLDGRPLHPSRWLQWLRRLPNRTSDPTTEYQELGALLRPLC